MHGDDVGAGLGEGFEIADRTARSSDACRTPSSNAGASPARRPGPNEMFGTKCPSITSRWIQSAPACVDRAHLLAEPGEIGGEDRRGDRGAGASISFNEIRHASVSRRQAMRGATRRASGFSICGHQVDRKLRDREIEPGQVRHGRCRRRRASGPCCGCRPRGRAPAPAPCRAGRTPASVSAARPSERPNDSAVRPSTFSGSLRIATKHAVHQGDREEEQRDHAQARRCAPSARSIQWLADDRGAPARRRARRRPACASSLAPSAIGESAMPPDEQRGEHRRGQRRRGGAHDQRRERERRIEPHQRGERRRGNHRRRGGLQDHRDVEAGQVVAPSRARRATARSAAACRASSRRPQRQPARAARNARAPRTGSTRRKARHSSANSA